MIPGNQPKALATKAFSKRIQIEIEGLQSTLFRPTTPTSKTPPHVLLSWLRNMFPNLKIPVYVKHCKEYLHICLVISSNLENDRLKNMHTSTVVPLMQNCNCQQSQRVIHNLFLLLSFCWDSLSCQSA